MLNHYHGNPKILDIILYKDEDGIYIAECPSIPGCVSPALISPNQRICVQFLILAIITALLLNNF